MTGGLWARATLAFTALTGLYCWKVLSSISTHLAGHGDDAWQNLWNMWWLHEAVSQGTSPYFTSMLHHPSGITLLFQTLNPFNAVLAWPFETLFGQPAAYNLVVLISYVASGLAMAWLAHELFHDPWAAFVAGCAYTFSHFHFAHTQGHLQLVAMEWIPVFVGLLIRLGRSGSLRAGLGMGGALALVAFCDLYYLLAAVVIGAGVLVSYLAKQGRAGLDARRLAAFGAGVLLFMATAGVLLLSIIRAHRSTEIAPFHEARYWSSDLQAFFVPGWISAWSEPFRGVWSRWTGNTEECNQYLGYSIIALSAIAFLRGRREWVLWPWALLAVGGVLLSMGPSLHWGGTIHDSVPLPFRWLERAIPVLKLSGAPVRWHILTVFGAALLAGAGAAALAGLPARSSRSRLIRMVAVCVAVLLELFPRWVDTRPVKQPAFISDLRALPDDWVFYDLGKAEEALLRQIGHRHRLIGGYVSRLTRQAQAFERDTPVLKALRGEQVLPPATIRATGAALGLRVVIVRSDGEAPRRLARLGLNKRAADAGLEVWELGK